MNTILVSIISDQTVPNLLIIKELAGQYDDQVFISTRKMEEAGKSAWIEKSAGIETGVISRIVVDENNWTDIRGKLKSYNWPQNIECVVNLTGGTKIMTLAAFEFFAVPGNRIIYVPITKNSFKELHPNPGKTAVPIRFSLNVDQYLTVHGINYSQKEDLKKPAGELKKLFKTYKNKGYNIENLFKDYPPEWKNYFTGEWFEEYLFVRIKEDVKLPDDHIAQGVKLMHAQEMPVDKNDQELDIVFTYNNEIYIVEAKVSIGNIKLNKDLLHQIMFKLSAINKNFGLRSHAFVVTLADTGEKPESFRLDLKRKMKVLGIRMLIDRNDFKGEGFSFRQLVH